jgi:hypothetical protein
MEVKIMSHGRSHNRFHRFLAKKRRQFLKTFKDWELPKDELLHKFKERKSELIGT